jgi:hypothetical protein
MDIGGINFNYYDCYRLSTLTADNSSNSNINIKDSKNNKNNKDKNSKNKNILNTMDEEDYSNYPMTYDIPPDEEIIKVVSKSDFVVKYVGHTAPKTNALLE